MNVLCLYNSIYNAKYTKYTKFRPNFKVKFYNLLIFKYLQNAYYAKYVKIYSFYFGMHNNLTKCHDKMTEGA